MMPVESSPQITPHAHTLRIYWEDTDAGGIVYHASHVRFFERGRTEFLRALGVSQSAFSDRAQPDALLFTVRRMEIDYLRPARLDDLLTVETSVKAIGGSRLDLAQRLLRGEEVIAEALVVIVAVGGNGRAKRIPDPMRALFAAAQ